jgi:hypothetical protein
VDNLMGAFRRRTAGTTNYIPEATEIIASQSSLVFSSLGEAIPVTARVVDQRGRDLLSQPAITMDTLDHSIATVSSGTVTSVASGSTVLRLQTGALSLDIPLDVATAAPTLDHITASLSSYNVVDTDPAPTLTPHPWANVDETAAFAGSTNYAYSSDTPAVATIGASTGVITLQGPGTVNFLVTETISGKTATATLTVTAPAPAGATSGGGLIFMFNH